MRRVLILAYSFPPINEAAALRVASFARHLPALGWEPVVLAPERGLGRGYGLPVPEGIEEWRVPDPDPVKALAMRRQAAAGLPGAGQTGLAGLLRRVYRGALFPDRDILWAARAALHARWRLRERPDIVAILSSSSGASKHWAASWLKRWTGLPWVADFHDPWAGDTLLERPRSRFRAWLERRLEGSLCRLADRVVTVGNGYVPRLICDPAQVTVIPAGFEPSDYVGLPAAPPGPEESPFRIAHAGTLYGGARDPTGLFAAVRLLLDRGAVREHGLEILLIGSEEPAVREMALAAGVGDHVRWTGTVIHRQSLELLASSHLLAVITTPGGFEIPSKVYEYLAVGRPVLALWRSDGDLPDLVRATGAGDVVDPRDVPAIAGAIARSHAAWWRGQPRGPAGDMVSGLTRRAAASRLAAVLDQVTGR